MDCPTIGITWRDDGSGKGAFWDHYTIQKMLRLPTAIINESTVKIGPVVKDRTRRQLHTLAQFQKTVDASFPVASVRHAKSLDNIVLIVIPGVDRRSDTPKRQWFEERLLCREYQRGRLPIVLLCGAMYRLSALGIKIGAVSHHANNGGMVRLNNNGKVVYNTSIHFVETGKGDRARAIWGKEQRFPVNSVHSDSVVDLAHRRGEFEIVARSTGACLTEKGTVRKTRGKDIMEPQEGVIEAIVSKDTSRAPLVGVQWHPEAYGDDPNHYRLFSYALNYDPIGDIVADIVLLFK